MARKETGFLQSLINRITGTGVTVRKTTDFWGNKRTIVRNYNTGTTKTVTHGQGFFGNKTDVRIERDGKTVLKGRIGKNFLGEKCKTMEYAEGRMRKSVHKSNCGFFGNKDETVHYDACGRVVGRGRGRHGLLLDTYKREYEGTCFACNGTGVFRSGKTCRKCGGTGIFRKSR